jgi:diguanylate cyclase (GGDEF)-like protein
VVAGAALAAAGLALPPGLGAGLSLDLPPISIATILVAASIVNVELGHFLEGGTTVGRRPHRGLSVWAFASALLISPVWLLAVVPLTYAHAYWRGMRPPVWQWAGAAAFVVLAGLAAHHTLFALSGEELLGTGVRDLLALLAAVAAFLAAESVLFALLARSTDAEQAGWLRTTLAQPSFYLTELGMLSVGAVTAVVWYRMPWYGVLLVPAYALVQQAALFDPLRREATQDDKTGLLRFEPWRARSLLLIEEMSRTGRDWAVVMLDLDHFAAFNTRHGHLAADAVLGQVARAIETNVRAEDVACRFGGEEFALLLVDADEQVARRIAERLRAAIAETSRPTVTASVGVASMSGTQHDALPGAYLPHALVAADRALYDAKSAGRNRVIVHPLAA